MSDDPRDAASSPPAYAETHTVDTPEQTRLRFAVAGIGSRFLAMAIDTLIQIALALLLIIIAVVAGLSGVWRFLPGGELWHVAILIAVFFSIYYGYFAIFEILWSGQTPGKRAIGLRVVKDSGRPLTAAETIGRNLMRIVDQMPGMYGVGVIVVLLNSQNKRLGDFIAGSVAIREASLAQVRPIWHTSQTSNAPAHVPLGADRLTPEELALIDTFLNRRYDLAPDVRSRMAGEIMRRIGGRLSHAPQADMSVETILEAVAVERRSTGGYR